MSSESKDLLLLVSPPASGKTYWISVLKETVGNTEILVISPLRALADECQLRWKHSVTVMTPEEWMTKKVSASIVIFDEFHLYYYWGDSFRPRMWEVFYALSEDASFVIGLTATLSDEMKNDVARFSTCFDRILLADFGNRTLRNLPSLYLKAPSKKWILDEIFQQKKNSSVKLIFCEYREEVFALTKLLQEKGFVCLSCVGGEAGDFRKKLERNAEPDFIVCTTVLSHGVNLPAIAKIYFLYAVQNIDFWIQMVARGGRHGEKYEVIGLEKPQGLSFHFLQNQFHLWLRQIRRKFTVSSQFFLR